MQKPDLTKTWRTWIKIAPYPYTLKLVQDTIRNKMQLITQQKKITWFYFLIHPNPEDPNNAYFEVIFTTDGTDPNEFLPNDFRADDNPHDITSIAGIELKFLKGEDIGEAWKLIGEQSRFIINLICSHKENQEIPASQIVQFMHFFMNALGVGHKSLFLPVGSFYGAQSF
jgi:hypothetical protein